MELDKIKNLLKSRDKKNKYKVMDSFRHTFQSLWFLVIGSYVEGFKTRKIYGGNLKKICIPDMNCYSYPGAKGSRPIGSLQTVIGSSSLKFSYYIIRFLFLIGVLMGRFICGWLYPSGLIQDLLYRIPSFRKLKAFKYDKRLRKLKYFILLIFVIILPMFLVDILGQESSYFYKLACPIGMLEGEIPLVLLSKNIRGVIRFLYYWKGMILILTTLLSIVIYRSFCEYIYPLGVTYSLFSPISVFKYRLDKDKYVSYGRCRRVCQMNIDPTKNCNHKECIRRARCKNACPINAISCGIKDKNRY